MLMNNEGLKKQVFSQAANLIDNARNDRKELLMAINKAIVLLRVVETRMNGDEEVKAIIEKMRQVKLKVLVGNIRC